MIGELALATPANPASPRADRPGVIPGWPRPSCAAPADALAGFAGPTWPQRIMPLETQMPWRETIRLILLAVLIAALGTAAIKILVEQLS